MRSRISLSFVIVIAIMFAGLSATAQELAQPQPFGDQGQITLSLGYHYYKAEWESDNPDMEPGTVIQNYVHLIVAYGLAQDWEGFVLLGAADQVAEEAFPFDTPADFEAGFKPNAAVGFRGLVYKTSSFGVGPIFHAGIYSDYEDEKEGSTTIPGVGAIPVTIKQKSTDTWDVNFGVGLQYDLEKALLYAAPFYYVAKAKGEGTITTPMGEETFTATGEEKNNIGGLVGVKFVLGEDFSLNVEGQYKSDMSFSALLSKSFGFK